ncbi:MAG: ABC transporter substrate-binding protein [Erysipelotrichaceae bacterium]|nr:ABC transporter substrate-binding protein [Erysipelotrichaceae bacterium]
MKRMLTGLIALGLILAGCSSTDDSSSTTDLSEVKIGVIQLSQHDALDASYEGFKDTLVAAGVSEDNIDYQVAGGDQSNCTTIADKLVNDGNDLIYAIATSAAQAAQAATTDIPIVGCAITDYETAGLVESSDAPGGNVTGASDLTPVADQFDLMMELLPDTQSVAILYCGSEDNSIFQGNIAVETAEELGLDYKVYTVSDTNDIDAVVNQIASAGHDVVYIPTDNLLAEYMSTVEAITSQYQIPCIVGEEGMVSNGGFATYGISYYNLGVKAGEQALAILQGETTAAETPIEYLAAEDCTIVINLTIAEKCGITINQDDYPDATFVE